MENEARKLSEKIAVQMQFGEDKKAVIAYGLTAIFQILLIAAVISVIGILLHCWYEAFIVFIGVGILKKSTGGAHAQTILGCTVISVASITVFAVTSRYLFYQPLHIIIGCGITFLVFVLSAVVFYRRVPVDSPNKRIKNPAKIKRLRRQSFILLIAYTVISLVFSVLGLRHYRFNSLAFAVHFVLLWQALMLTKSGSRVFCTCDTQIQGKEV